MDMVVMHLIEFVVEEFHTLAIPDLLSETKVRDRHRCV